MKTARACISFWSKRSQKEGEDRKKNLRGERTGQSKKTEHLSGGIKKGRKKGAKNCTGQSCHLGRLKNRGKKGIKQGDQEGVEGLRAHLLVKRELKSLKRGKTISNQAMRMFGQIILKVGGAGENRS